MLQLFMATFLGSRPQETSQGGRWRRRLIEQLQEKIPVPIGKWASVLLRKTDFVLRDNSRFADAQLRAADLFDNYGRAGE